MTRAAFVDRDGTLNREQSFVSRPEQLQVLPGARAALALLRQIGLLPVVLTNQSGIARGLYGEADLARIHDRLHRELDGLPAGYLHCPHLPEASGPYGGDCECRKPASGLLRQAATLFEVDFTGSCLIGDSARDLLPLRELPLRRILVQSGKPWQRELAQLQQHGLAPIVVLPDLLAAAQWLQQHPID